MSKRDDRVPLQHMIDHCRLAVELSLGRKREDLDGDDLYRLAMIRAVEVIGEAATRLSPGFRNKYQTFPWTQIIGARNRLIHGYDQISTSILWEILSRDVPELLVHLEKMLKSFPSE